MHLQLKFNKFEKWKVDYNIFKKNCDKMAIDC